MPVTPSMQNYLTKRATFNSDLTVRSLFILQRYSCTGPKPLFFSSLYFNIHDLFTRLYRGITIIPKINLPTVFMTAQGTRQLVGPKI